MIFERIMGRAERQAPTEEEIKNVENELLAVLNQIEKKTPDIVREYQSLSPDQQDRVSREILAYMEKNHQKNMQNLLQGAVIAGLTGGAIGSAVFNAPGGIVGGVVGASVAILVPLIDKLRELQARRFFDNK